MSGGKCPSDQASPRAVVAALYDVISGSADDARDWDRFRSLFFHGARIILSSASIDGSIEAGKEWSVEEFAAAADGHYRKTGFWEREITSQLEEFGNIAHVFSAYESRVVSEESEPVSRGINSIQMVRTGDRWSVVSLVFDVARPGNPLPGKYR